LSLEAGLGCERVGEDVGLEGLEGALDGGVRQVAIVVDRLAAVRAGAGEKEVVTIVVAVG